jgi:hypothetical protein
VLFVIIWSLMPNFSERIIVLFFVWALILAGYHSWYVDHIRLVPKLELGSVRIVKTPTTEMIGPVTRPGPTRIVAQILVKRLTDTPIEDCRGQLLGVWKWFEIEKDWKPTDVDETQELVWSIADQPVRTLHADQQLNLFHIDDVASPQITLSVYGLPYRMAAVFAGAGPNDTYKFDISVFGKNCPSVKTSLRVQMGPTWDSPKISCIRFSQVGKNQKPMGGISN